MQPPPPSSPPPSSPPPGSQEAGSTIRYRDVGLDQPPSAVPQARPTKGRTLGPMFWIAAGWIVLVALAAIFANLLPLPAPDAIGSGTPLAGPSLAHLFGTDELGRDILSRIIFGSRVSLILGFASIAIGTVIGGGLGLIAGYLGGPFDSLSNALAYIILAFPPLLLLLALAAFSKPTLLKLVAEFAFLSIAPLFRVVRAATISIASRDFVQAALSLGATRARILMREIFPSVLPSLVSYALLGVALVIVGEGSLAFLGLSISLPTPSWGNMIAEGRTFLATDPWISLFPAIAMFSVLLALNLVADKLSERLDVREGQL